MRRIYVRSDPSRTLGFTSIHQVGSHPTGLCQQRLVDITLKELNYNLSSKYLRDRFELQFDTAIIHFKNDVYHLLVFPSKLSEEFKTGVEKSLRERFPIVDANTWDRKTLPIIPYILLAVRKTYEKATRLQMQFHQTEPIVCIFHRDYFSFKTSISDHGSSLTEQSTSNLDTISATTPTPPSISTSKAYIKVDEKGPTSNIINYNVIQSPGIPVLGSLVAQLPLTTVLSSPIEQGEIIVGKIIKPSRQSTTIPMNFKDDSIIHVSKEKTPIIHVRNDGDNHHNESETKKEMEHKMCTTSSKILDSEENETSEDISKLELRIYELIQSCGTKVLVKYPQSHILFEWYQFYSLVVNIS